MHTVVIGGSGHIGTYLVPRLVEAGHQVTVLSRGRRSPYSAHGAWSAVHTVIIDREEEEQSEAFGRRILALHPDVVIDLICFKPESARQLVDALRGDIQLLLHCGTIWIHGPTTVAPTTEEVPRRPFGDYGTQKAAIEAYLLDQARRHGFPVALLHPGHIVGPGWAPVNPAGHFNLETFEILARGETLTLPNLGMETVHHVHADDVAQSFMAAIATRSTAVGESFHVVSPAALTLRGYAEAVCRWFGVQPNLHYLGWDAWRDTVPEGDARATWDHIAHSPNCSIEKARRLLDYRPRYSSLQAVFEALDWLIAHQRLTVPHPEAQRGA